MTLKKEQPLMVQLKSMETVSLDERREKVFAAVMDEYLQDVQNRFELMTSMNAKALEGYKNDPAAREKYLKSFEEISPDFQADVLVKLYKNDAENGTVLQECLKNHDAEKLGALYRAAQKENTPDFAKIREEKGGWRYIGPNGNPKLYEEKMSLMTSLMNRHASFDGTVSDDGRRKELEGYCALGVMISLYKLKDYYGEKAFDFLPEAQTAVKPKNLVEHLGDSPYVLRAEAGKFRSLAEQENLQPGTLFISTRKNGTPHHMMMYERPENGENFLMGFNDDKKNTPAGKINGVAVNIPALIKNSISKMTSEELAAVEQKMAVPPASRDWDLLLKEGKSYTPRQQWENYYRRSDVRFETKKHINAAKQALIQRRKGRENG